MLSVLLTQFGQCPLGDELSCGDDADPVGHPLGNLEDMRRHDHRAAVAHALAEQAFDVTGRDRIEPGKRLVQNDQARRVHQGARQRDLLAHTLGKTFAALVQMGLQSERRQ